MAQSKNTSTTRADLRPRYVTFTGHGMHFVIEEAHYEYHGNRRVLNPGKKLPFDPRTQTWRGNLNNPAERELIEAARECLESNDPVVRDKVKATRLTEVVGGHATRPTPKWDTMSLAAIETLVTDGGLSIGRCREYEQNRGEAARGDVLDLLDKLEAAAAAGPDDDLTVEL